MNPKIPTERNQTIDVARGLLMFYIVAIIHGFYWLNLVPEIVRSALLFEMPLVFIISGYALYLADANKKAKVQQAGVKQYLKFMFARSSRILFPYFAYALACILLCYVHSQYDDQSTWQLSQIVAGWLNPFDFQSEYTIDSLKWHLWFIPSFLLVTALLPFVIKLRLPFPVPLEMLMIGATVAVYLVSLCNFPEAELFKSVFFYLLWAIFGYHIAMLGISFYKSEYLKIAIISIFGLLISLILSHDFKTLIMQHNKFPPNQLFFLFNCMWVAIIFSIVAFFPKKSQDFSTRLANQWWLKPFIVAGYSIYLWQGLGYTIAIRLGSHFGLPILVTWLTALLFSVALGLLASPVERIKIKF